MNYFIFQGNEHDCGFAALKMLLATLAKDKSYLYISKPDKKENYTIKDLQTIADSFNVSLEASTCDEEYLNFLSCPCLALINTNHVVMIKKKTKNFLQIFDPATGVKWINKKKFKLIFSRIIVEVLDCSKIQRIRRIRKSILPNKMHVGQILLSFISTFSLIISFYFLNNISNFIYSVIFLACFAFTQFLESYVLHKQINYFDEKYIPLYFERKDRKNKNSYTKFLSFKREFFLSNRSLLSSVLLAFSITFLMCFNDFRNILALVLIILLKLLDLIIFSKPNKTIYEKVERLETVGLDDEDHSVDSLLSANKFSNNKVFIDSIKNLLFMILSFLLSIGMMFITGNSGCNYVIFHFVLYYVGYKTYSDLLLSISDSKNQRRNECQFIDDCNL